MQGCQGPWGDTVNLCISITDMTCKCIFVKRGNLGFGDFCFCTGDWNLWGLLFILSCFSYQIVRFHQEDWVWEECRVKECSFWHKIWMHMHFLAKLVITAIVIWTNCWKAQVVQFWLSVIREHFWKCNNLFEDFCKNHAMFCGKLKVMRVLWIFVSLSLKSKKVTKQNWWKLH